MLTYPLKCSHDSSQKSDASGLTIPLRRHPSSQLQKTNPSATISSSQSWNNSYLTWLQFHKSCYYVCRFLWQMWLKSYGDKDFLGLIFINAKNLSQYSSVNTLCFLFSTVQHWFVIYIYIYIYKGKAIPLQAWTGPEGSRRLRLPEFKTIGTWRW